MTSIILLFIFAVICTVVNGQKSCRSVNGGKDQCISIYNCQPLLSIINNPNRTPQDIEVLKRSQCGYQGNTPAVCCPEVTTLTASPDPQCVTPEGKPGQCISLYSCTNLISLLRNPPVPTELLQFLEKSKCNGPDQYSVCCGPVPDFSKSKSCSAQVTALPPDPKSECCGIDATTGNKIVGGLATTVDEYPWMVLIEHKNGGTTLTPCGGVLISGKYVLTAAHCITGRLTNVGRPTHVRLGEYDTSHEGPDCAATEAGGQDCTDGILSIPIEKIISHPEYDPKSTQKRHDIALIRLRQMAPYTDFIRPICLPTQDMTLRTKPFNLTAAGWGNDDSGQSSPLKLQVDLPFVNRDECAPNTTIGTLWKGQLCAGGRRGQDSCRGDSGGPLMFENARKYEVIGIVSVGAVPCGLENIPGVYTNVYEYVSWIRKNIAL